MSLNIFIKACLKSLSTVFIILFFGGLFLLICFLLVKGYILLLLCNFYCMLEVYEAVLLNGFFFLFLCCFIQGSSFFFSVVNLFRIILILLRHVFKFCLKSSRITSFALVVVVQLLSRVQLCDSMDCSTPPCPSLYTEVCPSSCPLGQWCYPIILSSASCFSFCFY